MRGTLWWFGDTAPGTFPTALPGDVYLNRLTGDLYLYVSGVWTPNGTLPGGATPPSDPAAGTAGLRTLGTGALQAMAGDDPRVLRGHRINYVHNPAVLAPASSSTSTPGWSSSAGTGAAATLTRQTGSGITGGPDAFTRQAWTGAQTAFTAPGYVRALHQAADGVSAVAAPGASVGISAWVRPSKAQSLRLAVASTTASVNAAPAVACPAGVWTRLTAVVVLTAAANPNVVVVTDAAAGTLWAVGDTLDVTGAVAEINVAAAGSYFDGATAGAQYTADPSSTARGSVTLLRNTTPTNGGAHLPVLDAAGYLLAFDAAGPAHPVTLRQIGPAGLRRNLMPNPGGRGGTTGWSLATTGLTGAAPTLATPSWIGATITGVDAGRWPLSVAVMGTPTTQAVSGSTITLTSPTAPVPPAGSTVRLFCRITGVSPSQWRFQFVNVAGAVLTTATNGPAIVPPGAVGVRWVYVYTAATTTSLTGNLIAVTSLHVEADPGDSLDTLGTFDGYTSGAAFAGDPATSVSLYAQGVPGRADLAPDGRLDTLDAVRAANPVTLRQVGSPAVRRNTMPNAGQRVSGGWSKGPSSGTGDYLATEVMPYPYAPTSGPDAGRWPNAYRLNFGQSGAGTQTGYSPAARLPAPGEWWSGFLRAGHSSASQQNTSGRWEYLDSLGANPNVVGTTGAFSYNSGAGGQTWQVQDRVPAGAVAVRAAVTYSGTWAFQDRGYITGVHVEWGQVDLVTAGTFDGYTADAAFSGSDALSDSLLAAGVRGRVETDSSGRLAVLAPTADAHAVPRRYVDRLPASRMLYHNTAENLAAYNAGTVTVTSGWIPDTARGDSAAASDITVGGTSQLIVARAGLYRATLDITGTPTGILLGLTINGGALLPWIGGPAGNAVAYRLDELVRVSAGAIFRVVGVSASTSTAVFQVPQAIDFGTTAPGTGRQYVPRWSLTYVGP